MKAAAAAAKQQPPEERNGKRRRRRRRKRNKRSSSVGGGGGGGWYQSLVSLSHWLDRSCFSSGVLLFFIFLVPGEKKVAVSAVAVIIPQTNCSLTGRERGNGGVQSDVLFYNDSNLHSHSLTRGSRTKRDLTLPSAEATRLFTQLREASKFFFFGPTTIKN